MHKICKFIHPKFKTIISLLENGKYNCLNLTPHIGTYKSYYDGLIIRLNTSDGELIFTKIPDRDEYLFSNDTDFDPDLYSIVHNRGGLGNQLFSYAYALWLTNNYNIKVKIGHCRDIKRVDHLSSNFQLSDKVGLVTPLEDRVFTKWWVDQPSQPPTIKYKKLNSYTLPIRYQWLKGNEAELRKAFTLKVSLDDVNLAFLEQIKSCENPVAIHIRRGDYLFASMSEIYARLELTDYYDKAIEAIKSKLTNPTFFVFCEDANFIRHSFLKDRPGFTYIGCNINDQRKAVFDLELMKNCKHFIIANSTFSYWGAFLSKNPNKIVIGPSKWSTLDNIDLLLDPSWTIRV